MKNTLSNKINLVVVVCILISAAIPALAYAAPVAIGGGYSCEGSTITKNGKTVSVSKAKAAVQTKINNLGGGAKNKTKKQALKDLKKALADCAKGIVPVAAAGSYTGTLTRVSGLGETIACDHPADIAGSFVIHGSNSALTSPAGNNPVNLKFSGKTSAAGFALSGRKNGSIRQDYVLTATNLTETSAAFTVVDTGSNAATRFHGGFVCKVTYSGAVTRP